MAERRKGRKKREDELKNEEDKPSKAEYAISKYLRSKLPEKKTTLLSHKVSYFIASKAIDCLLESPWSTGKEKSKAVLFTSREAVVRYMDMMLRHKFFHRARKIVVQKEKKKKKEEEEEIKEIKDSKKKKGNDKEEKEEIKAIKDTNKKKEKEKEEIKDIKKKKGKDKEEKEEIKEVKDIKKKKGKDKEEKTDDKEKKEGDEVDKKKKEEVEKKKEKKKFKLDMHMEQQFVDGNEVFVWIYEPVPVKTWIVGTLLVVGAVTVCLFPLWPKTVRHYVYYISVAAAGFLVFIIALAIIRLVVFVLVWLVTFGKHHLWLLPNLTEDVGFFDSFWPLYKYEFKGGDEKEDGKEGDEKEDGKEGGEKEDGKEGDGKEGDWAIDRVKDMPIEEEEVKIENEDVESEEEEEEAGGGESEKEEGSRESSKNGDEFEILEPDENYDEEEKEGQCS